MIARWRRVAQAVAARPLFVDVWVFGLIALSMVVEYTATRGAMNSIYGLSAFQKRLSVSLVVTIALVLLFRRRAPFTVFLAIASMQFVLLARTGWVPFTVEWCLYISTYTVASRKSLRWAVGAVLLATLSWSILPSSVRCPCMIQLGSFLIFAAITGVSLQAGRRLLGELRQQAGVLKSTRDERLKLALEQERSRVARELHDVVAHAVTIMVVQAGAARMIAATDPPRADDTLARVEAMAGEAVRELGSLVGSLGSDAGPVAAARPPPGVEAIPSLIEEERTAGLDVELRTEGESHPLDPAMGISLYRIVQEGLTNVRKHAAGARTRVALRYRPQDVEVEVTNAAPPRTTIGAVPGFGRGLIGIRERAALFAGEASTGPTPDGGFRVSARLPLELVPA